MENPGKVFYSCLTLKDRWCTQWAIYYLISFKRFDIKQEHIWNINEARAERTQFRTAKGNGVVLWRSTSTSLSKYSEKMHTLELTVVATVGGPSLPIYYFLLSFIIYLKISFLLLCCLFCFGFLFGDRVCLGWPQTHDSLVSSSQELQLHIYVIIKLNLFWSLTQLSSLPQIY